MSGGSADTSGGPADGGIGLIDYGAGNLRSVEFALDGLGVPHRRVAAPGELEGLERVVLPGVGAASWAMEELRSRGLVDSLRRWEGPLLGICLGMQLLLEISEEGGEETRCLGRLPGRVRRIETGDPLPHMGWNRLSDLRSPLFEGIPDGAHVYFLHSLRVITDREHVAGWTRYGEPFPSALASDGLSAVQFHPEKSGAIGLRILANFSGMPFPRERVRAALDQREGAA